MDKRGRKIMATWEQIESREPDISTERLMTMVCDACHCDVSEVTAALERGQHEQEQKGE